MSAPYTPQTAVGAIRLILASATSDRTAVPLIAAVIENTEATPGHDLTGAAALLAEFKRIGARFEVNSGDEEDPA